MRVKHPAPEVFCLFTYNILMYSTGEKAAWDKIREAGPAEISRLSGIPFTDGSYMLRSFGMDFRIEPSRESIRARSPEGETLHKRFSYFFNHLALWWLVHSRGIAPSGRLVKPGDLKGGEMFFRGTHTLPLEGLAKRYARDKDGFLARAESLGGRRRDSFTADASVELMPAHGLSVYLLLWLEDEEFPARADILFDSSVERTLPLDIIWSAAMLTALVMF